MGSDQSRTVVSSALRTQLLSLSTVVSKPKGSLVFRRGEPCSGVFLICKGKIRLTLDDTDAIFPPRILHEGSVVGLPSALGGSAYSLTAEVIENAELACIPVQALSDCLQKNAQLCFEIMTMLGHEVSTTRAAIKQSTTPRPRGR